MSWPSRTDRIDHTGASGHVWRQIADDIAADIESGDLPAGAQLPSGPALAEVYGVAKATVARAVAALKEDGVVTVVFGRGTFVAKK
jgi:DNA-binding GntR family transcriptional regulator